MSFLTAEWRKLALANYEVDPDLLQSYVPAKTELDLWQGRCYASLVGFMFKNVRLRGIKIPFHVNFEEVNLRFYVRFKEEGKWKRGVVFVSEIVPKPAISIVANLLYREHYETMPMRHKWKLDGPEMEVQYQWKNKGEWYNFEVKADKSSVPIAVGSEAEFITEHYWGYTEHPSRRTIEYQVTHPRWEQYAVHDFKVEADFGKLYGEEFAFLSESFPTSVILAEGSPITIEGRNFV